MLEWVTQFPIVPHKYALANLVSIGSDYVLLPIRHQAIV